MKKHHLNDETANTFFEFLNEKFKNNEIDFKQLVDSYKSMKSKYENPYLYLLLRNKKFFKELIQNNQLNQEDLKYLLNEVDRKLELANLSENTILLKYIVDKDLLSFKDLVDKFKNIKDEDDVPYLYRLLYTKELFEELIQNNNLIIEDLKYLLDKIDRSGELRHLCWNTPLIKYILNEFVLSKEDVDRFNTILENDEECKRENIQTIFDLVEDWYKNRYGNNEEVLKLNELNKYVCSFDEEQALELYELIKDNEIALNRLIQLIDNHLELNYDFESLMNYLKKKEKKNLINI